MAVYFLLIIIFVFLHENLTAMSNSSNPLRSFPAAMSPKESSELDDSRVKHQEAVPAALDVLETSLDGLERRHSFLVTHKERSLACQYQFVIHCISGHGNQRIAQMKGVYYFGIYHDEINEKQQQPFRIKLTEGPDSLRQCSHIFKISKNLFETLRENREIQDSQRYKYSEKKENSGCCCVM